MLVQLTFAAVRSFANAGVGTKLVVFATIVVTTYKSMAAALPVVVSVTVCANVGDRVERTNNGDPTRLLSKLRCIA